MLCVRRTICDTYEYSRELLRIVNVNFMFRYLTLSCFILLALSCAKDEEFCYPEDNFETDLAIDIVFEKGREWANLMCTCSGEMPIPGEVNYTQFPPNDPEGCKGQSEDIYRNLVDCMYEAEADFVVRSCEDSVEETISAFEQCQLVNTTTYQECARDSRESFRSNIFGFSRLLQCVA